MYALLLFALAVTGTRLHYVIDEIVTQCTSEICENLELPLQGLEEFSDCLNSLPETCEVQTHETLHYLTTDPKIVCSGYAESEVNYAFNVIMIDTTTFKPANDGVLISPVGGYYHVEIGGPLNFGIPVEYFYQVYEIGDFTTQPRCLNIDNSGLSDKWQSFGRLQNTRPMWMSTSRSVVTEFLTAAPHTIMVLGGLGKNTAYRSSEDVSIPIKVNSTISYVALHRGSNNTKVEN